MRTRRFSPGDSLPKLVGALPCTIRIAPGAPVHALDVLDAERTGQRGDLPRHVGEDLAREPVVEILGHVLGGLEHCLVMSAGGGGLFLLLHFLLSRDQREELLALGLKAPDLHL
ncbi:hypothetical protein ACFQWF_03940 [Methylorubrum suomiense]